eukprot:scaffold125911_cov63-Phaeocystis_antarctica.AAC.1
MVNRVDDSDDSATRHLGLCAASAICSERLASVAQPPRSAGRRSSMESHDGAEDVASGMAIGASGLWATEAVRALATSLHLPSPAALTAATLKAYCQQAAPAAQCPRLLAQGPGSQHSPATVEQEVHGGGEAPMRASRSRTRASLHAGCEGHPASEVAMARVGETAEALAAVQG